MYQVCIIFSFLKMHSLECNIMEFFIKKNYNALFFYFHKIRSDHVQSAIRNSTNAVLKSLPKSADQSLPYDPHFPVIKDVFKPQEIIRLCYY